MATYENLQIDYNPANGGIYALFNVGSQQYYADIADIPYCGVECMIFKAKDDEVTDWCEEYASRDILLSVSEKSLKDCIKEFTESLK